MTSWNTFQFVHYSITAELSHDVYQIVTFEKTLNYFDLASDKNRNNGPQTKRHFAYTQTCVMIINWLIMIKLHHISWHANLIILGMFMNICRSEFIPAPVCDNKYQVLGGQ